MEKELYFAQIEKQRQTLYEQMHSEHLKREIEINEYLDKALDLESQPQPSTSGQLKMIDELDEGNGTDDEHFEMPLPPLPSPSSFSKSSAGVSGQTSIIDNEAVDNKTPSICSVKLEDETPKIENNSSSLFKFPPVQSTSRQFDPSPPIPPRIFSTPLTPIVMLTDDYKNNANNNSLSGEQENVSASLTEPEVVDLKGSKIILESDL